MSIRKFIEENYRHFNAGVLAECSDSLRKFIDNKGRMMITLAGAMSTAEIGRTLAPVLPKNSCNLLYGCQFRRRFV